MRKTTEPLQFVNTHDYIHITGNKLPHWNQQYCVQFVTFRLADSLPQEKLREYKEQKEAWETNHPRPWDEETKKEYDETFTAVIDKWIDAGYGECILAERNVRDIVSTAIMHFDGERYDIHAYVIMPNHVHVLLTPRQGSLVQEIVGNWKRFTAREINKRLGRSGTIWERNHFDHLVRNMDNFNETMLYINENPRHLPSANYTLYKAM